MSFDKEAIDATTVAAELLGIEAAALLAVAEVESALWELDPPKASPRIGKISGIPMLPRWWQRHCRRQANPPASSRHSSTGLA
ncbi:hypothetical protein BPNPMPFG_000465 [Mesorhizobium sp. AR07]|uniref:hypothetical protein n=1 Tax=Mesorhizobium sp. AR07 TaxID=2865838 RepID=UPI00215FDB26|nr:hypothetical protein [Mesorhizobium sp. AR07]UVK44984.1 hypothetical protein BPNPMPFG_000465 [Mesorhizobium sp. AR07]